MRRALHFIREYFGFSRTELNGFLVLLPLMAIALVAPAVYRGWVSRDRYDDPLVVRQLDSLVARLEDSARVHPVRERNLFEFDPNTATVEDLEELGFPAYLARRVENYRTKGGRFRSSNDLRKIYGMDTVLFQTLQPYVRIPEIKRSDEPTPHASTAIAQDAPFDLNQADTTQLKAVFGIGSKLAIRIVRYRESLGGFVDENQLKEVFGLDPVVVEELQKRSYIADSFVPSRININQATAGELDRHPYISPQVARAIASYRLQHGSFSSVDDTRKVAIMSDSVLQRLRPYLSAERP